MRSGEKEKGAKRERNGQMNQASRSRSVLQVSTHPPKEPKDRRCVFRLGRNGSRKSQEWL
ncbi:hypothetical protein BD777DRAFT_128319, partial [Yarrowia lipolytica]